MLRSADPVPDIVHSGAIRDRNAVASINRIALWCYFGTLAVITLAHPSASRIHGWPLSALTTALWVLPAALLAIGLVRPPLWRLPPPLVLAGVALLSAATFASALLSPFAPASLPRVWPTIGGGALYLIFHHAWSAPGGQADRGFAAVARLLAGAGVIFTVVSLAIWSGDSWSAPWDSRNTAPFGHSTYVAGAIILFLPWMVLQLVLARGFGRMVCLIGAVGALLVLISTSSRGGVLALAVMIAAAAGWALFGSRSSWPRKLGVGFCLLVIGAVAVLTNPRLRDLIRHQGWSEGAKESNRQRQAMLSAGLQLGGERPFLGWGPGTVPLAYPRVRARLDGGTENILQLHNTPVQIWATIGGGGTMAMLLLLVGTTVAILRARRTPVTFAASAGLLGYGVVALTDHQLDLPAMVVLVAANLAVLTAGVSQKPVSLRLARLLVAVPIAIAVLGSLPATIRDLRARQLYDSALAALGHNERNAFIKQLDRAAAVAPHEAFFQHHAAAALLEARGATRDRAGQLSLARDAAARLERSLETGTYQEFAHFNLGWLCLDLDRFADAARHFAAAARLVPDKGGVYFGLGLACELAGNREAAVRCMALEWINDPRSLTSPAWELPHLAPLRSRVRDEVIRLYAGLRQDVSTAAVVEAWTRWWCGERIPPADLHPGFNAESARFVTELAAIERGDPISIHARPWAQAYAAWRSSTSATPPPEAFLAAARGDRDFAFALVRRGQQYRDSFRDFLAAPVGDEGAFLRTSRRQRTGYGMLALHPEGPPLNDLYVVQENLLIAEFAAGLFPAKGWLPGRYLLALLPEEFR